METLNLVSLWDIPVVFVIENNGYSMGTSLARSSAKESLAQRADGFNMEWEICDGHDVFEVREVANRAMTRVISTAVWAASTPRLWLESKHRFLA